MNPGTHARIVQELENIPVGVEFTTDEVLARFGGALAPTKTEVSYHIRASHLARWTGKAGRWIREGEQ